MSTFPAITAQRLIKALRTLGFEVIRKKAAIISFAIPTVGVLSRRFIVARQSAGGCWDKSCGTAKSP
jgi:hypothetical protein